MKEDFDFVTMSKYSDDMRKLSELGSGIITALIKERDEANACIAALVHAAGRIEIHDDFSYVEQPSYEVAKNPCNKTLIFRALNN